MVNHSEQKSFSEKILEEKTEGVKKEIEELKARIEKLESKIEGEKNVEEREKLIKQEIEAYLKELQKLPPFAAPKKVRDEAKEIAKFSKDQQVGALIALVFEKGLKEAISVAQALNNPAILDEFHDVLIDRFYQTLIEKKIVKPF